MATGCARHRIVRVVGVINPAQIAVCCTPWLMAALRSLPLRPSSVGHVNCAVRRTTSNIHNQLWAIAQR